MIPSVTKVPGRLLSMLRLVFGLLTLGAIGRQLGIHLGLGFDPVNFFSYFTNLANMYMAVVLISTAIGGFAQPRRLSRNSNARYVSAVNMVVVGIVFTLLLRDADLGSLLPWINVLLHYVMPVVAFADWLLDPPVRPLGFQVLLLSLIFPVLYLGYVLLRGHFIGWYPYPFLNPAAVGGYGVVSAYAVGIALTFLASGWVLSVLGNRVRGIQKEA